MCKSWIPHKLHTAHRRCFGETRAPEATIRNVRRTDLLAFFQRKANCAIGHVNVILGVFLSDNIYGNEALQRSTVAARDDPHLVYAGGLCGRILMDDRLVSGIGALHVAAVPVLVNHRDIDVTRRRVRVENECR